MCRFYGRGLNRYYRLCCRKGKRRGERLAWAYPGPDIRVRGHVMLRELPRAKQLKLRFPK